ncbi:MAG: transcriptional regulator [Acidobacteriota bacterium]|jgi:HTH-type transcriptional regulator/antitoxin HigA|nr:transcriptional regulator [Acidobacteriota bacterium]
MNTQIYGQLLSETIPAVITNEQEYKRIEEIFANLFKKKRSPEEDKLFDLLATLLENYEQKSLPKLETSNPIETLRFLMSENNLKQIDLIDIFKTQSIVSEVLAEKRQINLTQAKNLAEKFGVSLELFV